MSKQTQCWPRGVMQMNNPIQALIDAAIENLPKSYADVIAAAQAAMDQLPWEDAHDELTDAINANHPMKTKDYSQYSKAQSLVSNRHSKYELVDLVNHLLVEAALDDDGWRDIAEHFGDGTEPAVHVCAIGWDRPIEAYHGGDGVFYSEIHPIGAQRIEPSPTHFRALPQPPQEAEG